MTLEEPCLPALEPSSLNPALRASRSPPSNNNASAPFDEYEAWIDGNGNEIERDHLDRDGIPSPLPVEEQSEVEPRPLSTLNGPASILPSARTSTPDDSRPGPSASHLTLDVGTPPGSPRPSVGEVTESAALIQDLVTEFRKPHACSRVEHELELQKHLYRVQNHRFIRSQCSSLRDLRDLVDPTITGNEYIPHLLSRPDIHRNGQHEALEDSDLGPKPAEPADFTGLPNDARFRCLFEGHENDSTRPYNACLHFHERSRLGRPAMFSADVDSACGFAGSLAFCRQGIDWYPRPHRVSNITNNLHGVYMRVRTDIESGGEGGISEDASNEPIEVLQKISDIHQIALGRVFGGLRTEIFILFPNLRYHRGRTSEPASNFLTDEEECLWTDGVFLPSLIECLPSHLFTEVPGSWRAATANSLASSSEQGRTTNTSSIFG